MNTFEPGPFEEMAFLTSLGYKVLESMVIILKIRIHSGLQSLSDSSVLP